MNSCKYTFILDCDGVLTDGSFLYDKDGKAYKRFGADDADALKLISDKVQIVFVSADHRGLPITQKRVEDMGFELKHVKSKERLKWIHDHYDLNNTIYMGDSFEDIPILQSVFLGICPKNSLQCVKDAADVCVDAEGGNRAVAAAVIHIIRYYLKEDLYTLMQEKGYPFEVKNENC